MTAVTTERRSMSFKNRFRRWFFQGLREPSTSAHSHQAAWWKVMCLTGVDYFSSLGYAPGIAFLAANILSPLATVILVLLTLFGALPVYNRVSAESPHGQGSISMLERLLPRWKGKALVLILLGFAATDFIITITLSAADAAAHIAQNPWVPMFLKNPMGLTMFLIVVLGSVFLIGFKEAIATSLILVTLYLVLNVFVVGAALHHLWLDPGQIMHWQRLLVVKYESPWKMLLISTLLFPKLALGMSGFETGVAVMPLVKGDPTDTEENPVGRIRNTRKLLFWAAVIMSGFLITSSFATAVLIPEKHFQNGGLANGRALAYLAHEFLGDNFGAIYDISSIMILWFAGASAMTGLLNLVPRYLPRYGMAPEWTRATRPLVCFFTGIGFIVTWWFKADVDAQGGAYATGVLVLMTSAAFACTLVVWKEKSLRKVLYGIIALVFTYTTITNCIERPEGLQIAALFIGVIFLTSVWSRAIRTTELRVKDILFDPTAQAFIEQASTTAMHQVRILAHRPGGSDYKSKEEESRETHSIQHPEGDFIFLEVALGDPSGFHAEKLEVTGHIIDGYQVLRCTSPAIPNAIAAILMYIKKETKTIPHAYFGWTEGNPIIYIFKYIFFGEGETAPVTREILRELEVDPKLRPKIHVG